MNKYENKSVLTFILRFIISQVRPQVFLLKTHPDLRLVATLFSGSQRDTNHTLMDRHLIYACMCLVFVCVSACKCVSLPMYGGDVLQVSELHEGLVEIVKL